MAPQVLSGIFKCSLVLHCFLILSYFSISEVSSLIHTSGFPSIFACLG